jgi:membrane protein
MDRNGSEPSDDEKESPADLPPRAWKEILVATWREAGNDNLGLIAAGVAFYAFLAFVPLLTAFVLSYGLVADPASVVDHMQSLTSMMPSNAAAIVGDQLKSMTETPSGEKGIGLVVALAIALYGAAKGASSIMIALNIAYDVEKETRGFAKRTAIALAMTAGAVLALFAAILAISAMAMLERLLPGLSGITPLVLKLLFWGAAAGSVVLLLAIIYRYGPDRPDAPWRWITPGSTFATLGWLAATAGFGLYVSNFGDYNATYGSLGAVIVFLTWLYLSAYIVLLGAELNAEIEVRANARPAPARKPAEAVPPPPARQAAAPAPAHAAPPRPPGNSELVWKGAAYALLLGLLGRPRRLRAA